MKIRKKNRYPIYFLAYSFDRIDIFLTKYGHDRKGFFHEKFEKNDMGAACF